MTDDRQYRPLAPIEILNHFEEVKNRIHMLESDLRDVIELNNLTTERPKPARKPTMAKKPTSPKHDDVEEDKKLINQAIAKHDRAEHPSAQPTKIRKGGRVAAKKR